MGYCNTLTLRTKLQNRNNSAPGSSVTFRTTKRPGTPSKTQDPYPPQQYQLPTACRHHTLRRSSKESSAEEQNTTHNAPTLSRRRQLLQQPVHRITIRTPFSATQATHQPTTAAEMATTMYQPGLYLSIAAAISRRPTTHNRHLNTQETCSLTACEPTGVHVRTIHRFFRRRCPPWHLTRYRQKNTHLSPNSLRSSIRLARNRIATARTQEKGDEKKDAKHVVQTTNTQRNNKKGPFFRHQTATGAIAARLASTPSSFPPTTRNRQQTQSS